MLLRIIGLSHVLFVCSTWTRKEAGHFFSQKRHANRVRRHNQRKRKRLTLIVILSALLSCAPERSVWTLPRNNWWARNAGDTIDIGAWPDAMFVSNLRISKTTFVLLCEELGPFVRTRDPAARDPAQVKVGNPRVHSTGGSRAGRRIGLSVSLSGLVCQRRKIPSR